MLSCNLYIFFGEVSFKVFDPFLNWVVFFKSSLYILDNSLLSDAFFCKYFPPVLCPDLCNSYLGVLEQMEYSRGEGGGRGGEKSKTKCSCSDRILILYAWIELFNFFFCTFFLVLRLLFPRAMSSWY